MGEAKPRDNFRIVVIVLCVVMAVAFTAIVYSAYVNDLENQRSDLQAARLVNVSLGYTDNGQGVINVTGMFAILETQQLMTAPSKLTSTEKGC